jgi:hypothetical protein
MTKTFDAITEAIRNPKHPFRKTDHHPTKSSKHRYERRKVREYLHLGEWLDEELALARGA